MTPEQTAIIIHESACGKSTRAIEEMIGKDHSTIALFRQNSTIRPLIEEEMAYLLTKGLKAARQTTVKFAEYGASEECQPGKSDEKWAKIAADASKSILNVVTSSQPGTVINTLIQVNQAPEQSKELSSLASFLQANWSEPDRYADTTHTTDQDGQAVDNPIIDVEGNEHD
jgi:hypothetical protein